ncbi:integrator complex subunit 9 isoform X2 [Neltuma alba]|uniref:integrator complex subunit 9 isoform X2 n=1 Tax=Neltuma alba TaxID=207710 RepID=UPI0010A3B861|nr:integrator complex subunit 9-like isoform X2 [Prosopis alba]
MKLTCLSKGEGFHFPPCHMLNFCGLRILLDCPLDLSALTVFSPVPAGFTASRCKGRNNSQTFDSLGLEVGSDKRLKMEKPLDANSLIFAEPWYKSVKNLHLWNWCSIDVILISRPMGILALPFLTRMTGFSAKIYVTEVSARFGQFMMEDLVSMHAELRQFYGPEESNFPSWLRQEALEMLPSELREIILGKDGEELGSWMPLYSAADVKDCMLKVQTLKYAEEACYNGTLVIKALSSGVEFGGCNWILSGPKGNVGYISCSSFNSAHAMNFDFHSLQGTRILIYSDFSSVRITPNVEDDNSSSKPSVNDSLFLGYVEQAECFLNSDENSEEKEKLVFISACAIECVKDGGSVLIPVSQFGTLLQLLEQLIASLESSAMGVPIYIISSVAEELLAFLNIIPEWLCKQRQEKLFAGEPLFVHANLIKQKRLHVVPAIYSHKLLMNWQEPCIVFAPHWSLRLGPVVHLLRRWCGDSKSLLILEDVLNPELALLPFKPIAMRVLQCAFPSGIELPKVQPLLKILQPKIVLFPEDLRSQISFSSANSFTTSYYTEGKTLRVPCQKDNIELKIATDLASQFHWKKLKEGDINISRLKGELFLENAKHHLLLQNEQEDSSKRRPLLHWGSPDMGRLLTALSKLGINATLERVKSNTESQSTCILHVQDPHRALIQVGATSTVITAANENVANLIFEAIDSIMDGI